MENNAQKYNCIYCQKEIKLNELLQVDSTVKEMDSEEMEYIWDQFGEASIEARKSPMYSHMTDLGFLVLNVCMDCYQKALKKYQNS